jgi:hypothetical protein
MVDSQAEDQASQLETVGAIGRNLFDASRRNEAAEAA